MGSLLYIIGAVLVALWLIGLLAHIGGGLIHIILVIAVIVFVFPVHHGPTVHLKQAPAPHK